MAMGRTLSYFVLLQVISVIVIASLASKSVKQIARVNPTTFNISWGVDYTQTQTMFNSQHRQTLGDFFPSVLALVDRVTWYLLLVGGGRYPVELVEVTFPKVKAKLQLEGIQKKIPQLTQRQKVLNSYPSELAVVRRFWKYILDREGICGDMLWSSISNNLLNSVASLLKDCGFSVKGKVSWLFPFLRLTSAFDDIS
ncbi:hypothetical protein FXO37_25315 [Capsicum annuum]|nr:hypothetical protein FXO37_25315 [Capsicum annuum]